MKDGRGPYADKIAAHKKKENPDTIQKWVDALEEVTSVKGRQLTGYTGQGEFVKMMVSKVLKRLRKAKLNLSDKLVGIEDRLPELRRMLDTDSDSSDVRMIVISGIPGIGKTTLAKSLYNDICHLFDRHSFLGDIGDTTDKKALVALQNQLVSDIVQRDSAKLKSVEEGISFLKLRLSTWKVLILLDDVHEKSQLEALVGSLDWFGSGSRIIITTKRVLNLCEMAETDDVETYKVPEMEDSDALKLFCRYAFAKDCPEHDYVDLSERIVSATGKLPLAVELVGSHLSLLRDKRGAWESLLEKLQNVTDDKVENKLRITYEQLNSFQRHIFLDIACFLFGEDKRIASYMWDELQLYPSFEVEMLCLMSMVKIGDDNRMWIHDQLRKLGRKIVQEDCMKKGNNSRLWATEARKIFKQDESQMKVEALWLEMDNTEQKDKDGRSQTYLTGDQFKRVPNLRLLILDHFDIKKDFRNLLSKLLWLRWHGCPRAFNVINLNLEVLVVLDLSWSKVTEDSNIPSLPGSISSLSHLQNLDLYGCDNLHEVPLLPTSLATLHLTYDSSKLKSLDISNLTNLKELYLANNMEEEASPSTDGYLMVEPISLLGIGKVTKVETLKLCLPGFTKLPEMDALKQLRKLDLQCPDLQHLPRLPKSLKKLTLRDCKSLKTLPELKYLKSLSGLELLLCSVMEIEGLQNLSSLVALLISQCELVKLDGLECLTSLRTLTISYCDSLQGLPDLSNLKKLRTCHIQHCKNITQKDSL
ncbi:hypothetical protein ACJRO7_014776 [Eucalyptus globulus]|uniref:NB-ARC domain-containing protein n=1 Tax=Eucalyptus globulus TaxID=34317 RepID=A0ABD3LBV4_EUCGL